ncbi:MAG: hypothetical protein GXO06_04035, partial [Epsilonproteobacteria bacterium]|nr:hypothetical protein [Campylobacterota bacterium]
MVESRDAIDRKSLEIYSIISENIRYRDYSHIDLVALFFHEIMVYSTNFHIINSSSIEYQQEMKFPFLNSRYCRDIYRVEFKRGSKLSKPKSLYNIMEAIQSIIPLDRSIYISPSNSKDIKDFIVRNIFKYRFRQLSHGVYLPNWGDEVGRLRSLLYSIGETLNIGEGLDIFVDNFIGYVESFREDREIDTPENSYLLIDSNLTIQNRINSASFLQRGSRVISLGHGEHNIQIFDEPIVEYGELTYATDYITYGSREIPLSSRLFKRPDIYYRDSTIISNIFKGAEVKFKPIDGRSRVLYVPTSFSGNMRYGPYRDISDRDYAFWQRRLLAKGYNISYKGHPNGREYINFKIDSFEERPLVDILDDYDIFILDYISTASALLFATDKPIIFFDIAVRNLNSVVKSHFYDRVFRHKIDFKIDISSQIESAFRSYNRGRRGYINRYTE